MNSQRALTRKLCICQVADEEGVQVKAFHYAFERLNVRGLNEAEASHPSWNSFRKAMKGAGLTMDVMKLSLICVSGCAWLILAAIASFQKLYNS